MITINSFLSVVNIRQWADFNYLNWTAHGANMGPTWVLSAPGGPHVGPINLVIKVPLKLWHAWRTPSHNFMWMLLLLHYLNPSPKHCLANIYWWTTPRCCIESILHPRNFLMLVIHSTDSDKIYNLRPDVTTRLPNSRLAVSVRT